MTDSKPSDTPRTDVLPEVRAAVSAIIELTIARQCERIRAQREQLLRDKFARGYLTAPGDI